MVPLRDGSISHLKSSRKDDILATASCKKHFCQPDNTFSFNGTRIACASLSKNSNETLRFLERSVLVVACCMWVLTFAQWLVTSLVDAEYRQGTQGTHAQMPNISWHRFPSFSQATEHAILEPLPHPNDDGNGSLDSSKLWGKKTADGRLEVLPTCGSTRNDPNSPTTSFHSC